MKGLVSTIDIRGQLAVLAEDLTFRYAKLHVLDRLNLRISRGVSFGLLGPNGAGKTTLIRVLVGLLKSHGGQVLVLGERPSPETSRRIGYMPQLAALYNELSVVENVGFFAQVYGLKDRDTRWERLEEVVRLVDLWGRRNELVMNLSGGMRQRVSLVWPWYTSPHCCFWTSRP